MKNLLYLIVTTIILLSSAVSAGEKVVPLSTPRPQDIQNGGPGLDFTNNDGVIPLFIDKFDGRDANGNVVGYAALREIEVSMVLDCDLLLTITNNLANERGFWKWNIGTSPVLSTNLIRDAEDFYPKTTDSLLGLADRNMDPGETCYFPIWDDKLFVLRKKIKNPRELRLFCGQGQMPMYLLLGVDEDLTQVSGHGWSFTRNCYLRQIYNEFSNPPVYGLAGPTVKYIFDETATEFLKMQEINIQLPELRFTSDLPYTSVLFDGFSIDPSRIVRGEIVLTPNCWYYDGLENMNAVPAICGGTSEFRSSVFINGKHAVDGGLSRQVGSGDSTIPAFDGTCDFDGPSGSENWSMANSSMSSQPVPIRFMDEPWETSIMDVVGPNKQLDLFVTQVWANYIPVSPSNATQFAWWLINCISGKVTIRVWYR